MGRKVGKKAGQLGPSSLFLLSETNIIRRLTKFIIEWPPSDRMVLVTIMAPASWRWMTQIGLLVMFAIITFPIIGLNFYCVT